MLVTSSFFFFGTRQEEGVFMIFLTLVAYATNLFLRSFVPWIKMIR